MIEVTGKITKHTSGFKYRDGRARYYGRLLINDKELAPFDGCRVLVQINEKTGHGTIEIDGGKP